VLVGGKKSLAVEKGKGVREGGGYSTLGKVESAVSKRKIFLTPGGREGKSNCLTKVCLPEGKREKISPSH